MIENESGKKLVYDVGLCDGSDTRQYLEAGFQVVAVEANPAMAQRVAHDLAPHVASGDLTIVNTAISDGRGRQAFWVCESNPHWSSFDRSIASRNGASHHAVEVETSTLDSIFARYGVPWYLKIDIEGHDRVALSQITPDTKPEFVSVEMSHADAGDDIERLSDLGYTRFKIIAQNLSWREYAFPFSLVLDRPANAISSRLVRKAMRTVSGLGGIGGAPAPMPGSSGPVGAKTRGRWRSRDDVMRRWRTLRDNDLRQGSRGLGWWFDIHATTG